MKKIFYFTILAFMLIPFAVRAEINLEEIHNSISKDNEITVKSIPLEQYKETEIFKECMKKTYYQSFANPEQACLSEVYKPLIISKIKKSVEIPQNVNFWIRSIDSEKNTCEIEVTIGYDYANSVVEEYKINLEEVKVSKKPSKMKLNYKLADLGYINQILNYGTLKDFFTAMQVNSNVYKIYPELKEEMEKNKKFDYVIVSTSVGQGEFIYGAGADLVAYYNDIAVDYVNLRYTTYKRLYIPDTTTKTREEYAKVAEKRIKEYINDDSYEIKVEFDEHNNRELCESLEEGCIAKDVFKEGDKYSFEVYKLYLNGVGYELDVIPVPEKEIKKLSIKSKDYENDISVETESSDVPLDTSVKVEDLTIKYKGFMKAYDINLYSGIKDEYITKVKDGIFVKIPLPDEYDKKKVDIYHIKEDGKKGNKYEAKVEEIEGKKYAVFTTNHFSTYAIEEEIEEEIKDTNKEDISSGEVERIENPNTYDGVGSSIFLGIITLIGIIVSIVYLKKRNKVNN